MSAKIVLAQSLSVKRCFTVNLVKTKNTLRAHLNVKKMKFAFKSDNNIETENVGAGKPNLTYCIASKNMPICGTSIQKR